MSKTLLWWQQSQDLQCLSNAVAQWTAFRSAGIEDPTDLTMADEAPLPALNLPEAMRVFGGHVTIAQLKRVRSTVQTVLMGQGHLQNDQHALLSLWKANTGLCSDRSSNEVGDARPRSPTQSRKQDPVGVAQADSPEGEAQVSQADSPEGEAQVSQADSPVAEAQDGSKTTSIMRQLFMQKCQEMDQE